MVNWVDMPADLGKFDVVLASDVLYEHRYAEMVADAIAKTLVQRRRSDRRRPGAHRARRVPRGVLAIAA